MVVCLKNRHRRELARDNLAAQAAGVGIVFVTDELNRTHTGHRAFSDLEDPEVDAVLLEAGFVLRLDLGREKRSGLR